jgi:arsenate reductase
MRTKEEEYRTAGLDNPALTREQLIDALLQYPRLMERPIVVIDGRRAVIGRPPEKVLELL